MIEGPHPSKDNAEAREDTTWQIIWGHRGSSPAAQRGRRGDLTEERGRKQPALMGKALDG